MNSIKRFGDGIVNSVVTEELGFVGVVTFKSQACWKQFGWPWTSNCFPVGNVIIAASKTLHWSISPSQRSTPVARLQSFETPDFPKHLSFIILRGIQYSWSHWPTSFPMALLFLPSRRHLLYLPFNDFLLLIHNGIRVFRILPAFHVSFLVALFCLA